MSPLELRAAPCSPACWCSSWLATRAGGAVRSPGHRRDVSAATRRRRAAQRVRFRRTTASPALYDDEPVSLIDCERHRLDVTVMYDDADSMLRATPAQALGPGYRS